ncbi:MAG: hypothetical protein IJV22_02885 [Bacteroidales bacterium]|nr:hypothetical protein [Bacteroidales bacterium]
MGLSSREVKSGAQEDWPNGIASRFMNGMYRKLISEKAGAPTVRRLVVWTVMTVLLLSCHALMAQSEGDSLGTKQGVVRNVDVPHDTATSRLLLERAQQAYSKGNLVEAEQWLNACRLSGYPFTTAHVALWAEVDKMKLLNAIYDSTDAYAAIGSDTVAEMCSDFVGRYPADRDAERLRNMLYYYYIEQGELQKAELYANDVQLANMPEMSAYEPWARREPLFRRHAIGVGFDLVGWNSQVSFGMPVLYRAGSCGQRFNLLAGVRIGLHTTDTVLTYNNSIWMDTAGRYDGTPWYGMSNTVAHTELSLLLGGRCNFLRDDDLSLYAELDGLLHFNVKGRVKAPSSVDDDHVVRLPFADGFRKVSLGLQLSVGMSGDWLEMYITGRFNLTLPYNERAFDRLYLFDACPDITDATLYDVTTMNDDQLRRTIADRIPANHQGDYRIQNLLHSCNEFADILKERFYLGMGMTVFLSVGK